MRTERDVAGLTAKLLLALRALENINGTVVLRTAPRRACDGIPAQPTQRWCRLRRVTCAGCRAGGTGRGSDRAGEGAQRVVRSRLNSPSHEDITNAFARTGLTAGHPRRSASDPTGKVKRIRQVFIYATDHDPAAGLKLAKHLVALLRATGAFTAGSDCYAGPDKIAALQRAFRALTYDLDPSGGLRPPGGGQSLRVRPDRGAGLVRPAGRT